MSANILSGSKKSLLFKGVEFDNLRPYQQVTALH